MGAGRQAKGGSGDEASGSACFLSEQTALGEQWLVSGVQPLRLTDRLAFLAAAPLAPTKPQRSADFGLFDLNARNQLDLFGQPRCGNGGDDEADAMCPDARPRPEQSP